MVTTEAITLTLSHRARPEGGGADDRRPRTFHRQYGGGVSVNSPSRAKWHCDFWNQKLLMTTRSGSK